MSARTTFALVVRRSRDYHDDHDDDGHGDPCEAPALDDAQLLRYSRHILLPELGVEAQERFAAAHALVIGAGGLGAPVAQFLVAARRRHA